MIQYIEHIFLVLTFSVAVVALLFWILIIFSLFMFFRDVKNCDIERQSPTTQATSTSDGDIFFCDDGLPKIVFNQDFV